MNQSPCHALAEGETTQNRGGCTTPRRVPKIYNIIHSFSIRRRQRKFSPFNESVDASHRTHRDNLAHQLNPCELNAPATMKLTI